jgi:Cdc6-like AAA superfamily ATPase
LELDREKKEIIYKQQLAEMQDEISHQRRVLRNITDQEIREKVLAQQRRDLADLKARYDTGAGSIKDVASHLSCGVDLNKDSDTRLKTLSHNDLVGSPAETSPAKGDIPENFTEPSAQEEWERAKEFEGASNPALDKLMSMIGLEEVKEQFLTIKSKVDTVIRQGSSLKEERFGAAFLGNPGTGKTTVARLYAKFLSSVGVLPGEYFFETSGSRLASDGPAGVKKSIEEILNNGGGAFFVDEAYQLVSGNSYGGPQVLDLLLTEIENLTGKVVFIFAGYTKQMEAFFAHNPGIPSRIPYQLQFQDYKDPELLRILEHSIKEKYNGSMKVEGGQGGLYMRIAARRIGTGQGREGFGNARAVHNALAHITTRQAKRFQRERRASKPTNDLLFTKEDLIGPEPSTALEGNPSWKKLQSLIGLKSVKDSVKALLDSIQANYQRELEEQPYVQFSLNRVLLGSPGTGKTSVAKLYGQILADIGLLTNGEGESSLFLKMISSRVYN